MATNHSGSISNCNRFLCLSILKGWRPLAPGAQQPGEKESRPYSSTSKRSQRSSRRILNFQTHFAFTPVRRMNQTACCGIMKENGGVDDGILCLSQLRLVRPFIFRVTLSQKSLKMAELSWL